mmetsp:Transcript_39858/g.104395  ORF Transcript_39858/g.104395 Transcript_39858/m.104395 type:complete len:299 (+) Transcript_39858:7530-8426(+)
MSSTENGSPAPIRSAACTTEAVTASWHFLSKSTSGTPYAASESRSSRAALRSRLRLTHTGARRAAAAATRANTQIKKATIITTAGLAVQNHVAVLAAWSTESPPLVCRKQRKPMDDVSSGGGTGEKCPKMENSVRTESGSRNRGASDENDGSSRSVLKGCTWVISMAAKARRLKDHHNMLRKATRTKLLSERAARRGNTTATHRHATAASSNCATAGRTDTVVQSTQAFQWKALANPGRHTAQRGPWWPSAQTFEPKHTLPLPPPPRSAEQRTAKSRDESTSQNPGSATGDTCSPLSL